MRPTSLTSLSRRRNHPTMSGRSPLPADQVDRRPTLNEFVSRAASQAAAHQVRVLELGVATGGDDGSHRHFDPTRYRWLGLPTSAGWRQPSQAPLPVDDEQFGLALCADAVVASPEPQGLLTEVNRALEPAGLLFLAAPLMIPAGTSPATGWRSGIGLNYLLEASGFVIEEVVPLDGSRNYGVVAAKRRRPGHTPHPRSVAALSGGWTG